MKKGIVIGTSEYTKDFLKDCLDSIKGVDYDILVVSNGGYNPTELILENRRDHLKINRNFELIINENNGWEPAVIQRGKEDFDQFIFLMDSTIIKDTSLFDKLFEIPGNVVLTRPNFHYMGKFASKELPNLPIVKDKQMAVFFESRWLPKPYTEFTPDLPVHSNKFETIHGQYRMVLENIYMKKFKGTWVETPEHPIPK